jgi:RNA polymerase sigma factor (TIGR02999 family)
MTHASTAGTEPRFGSPLGGPDATSGGLETMVGLTYRRLRELARAYFRAERRDHTLQPTALVHEAYLRLCADQHRHWRSRAHFLSFAARVMRQVLIDEARSRRYLKRRRDGGRITLADELVQAEPPGVDALDLDRALRELAAYDPRKTALVELRFFGGLSIEEAAEALDVSIATVNREWRAARAWLAKALET